jgi:putative tryptophan/tyrosine transport system substrate-binding protein
MKRREFISLLGSAAVWPLAARAQQSAMPVIGYLGSFPPDTRQKFTQAFQHGLSEAGFIEGRNVTIEYRWAEADQYDRLPGMVADLIARRVDVLFASPINAAVAAKDATSTTPVVFAVGGDPVEMRLVATLNQPGGNATGATFLSVELGKKRVELLRNLLPKIGSVALLANPKNPTTAMQTKDMQAATTALGLKFLVVNISAMTDFENALATVVQQGVDALVVSADSLFWSLRDQLIGLAARRSLPAIYFAREFAAAGGLMSYNSDYADSIRQAGEYVGRILKGEKPADLPVLQPTKFELVINLNTAKALGITVPQALLVAADEVIE